MDEKIQPSKFRAPAPSPLSMFAAAASPAISLDTRYVTTDGVRFRKEPNGEIIRELTVGDPIRVIGNAPVPKWLMVESGGREGAVFGDYLRQPVAQSKEALLKNAIAEWVRFRKGKAQEATQPYAGYVGEMWQSLGLNYDGTSRYPNGDEVPWSAAFISFVVRKSGSQYARFKFHESHSVFSHDAIQARILANMNKPFWGYRITERKPALGDIIHRNRDGGSYSYDYAESHSEFKSHSDFVVEVRQNIVRVLGGNVGDTVSMSSFSGGDDLQEYTLDSSGFLAPGQRIIALLRNRSDDIVA